MDTGVFFIKESFFASGWCMANTRLQSVNAWAIKVEVQQKTQNIIKKVLYHYEPLDYKIK